QGIPNAFQALHGVVLTTAIIAYAAIVRRNKQQEHLARHCHFIGVPLSLAAVAYAFADPKSALACLCLYALLYAIEVWVFSAPALIYPASVAATAAVFTALVPIREVTLIQQAVGATALALVFGLAAELFPKTENAQRYRVPLTVSSLGVSIWALGIGSIFVMTAPHSSYTAAAIVFSLIGVLYVRMGFLYPSDLQRYAALLLLNIGAVLAAFELTVERQWAPSAAECALVSSAFGTCLFMIGLLVRSPAAAADRTEDEFADDGYSIPC